MINTTKTLIQQAVIELCVSRSFEKMRIHDICEKAGISRQTFYCYFKDKYDVVTSIFFQDVNGEIAFHAGYSYELSLKGLQSLWNKREFYRNVLNGYGQNSLYMFMQQFIIDVLTRSTTKKHDAPLTNEQKYQIFYCVYGFMGNLLEWLKGNIDCTVEEFVEMQCNTFPANSAIDYLSE